MAEYITVHVMGVDKKIEKGTMLLTLGKECQGAFRYPIILAKVDNELQELVRKLEYDCHVEFLDITDANGFRAYQRSVAFLLIYAAKSILGKETRIVVEHSINKNYYCEIPKVEITEELLQNIEKLMKEAAGKDIPIQKYSIPVEEGIRLSKEFGLMDKVSILKYRRSMNVNFYKLDWFYDYFYGQVAISTGYATRFKLTKRSTGFILQFPSPENEYEIIELGTNRKVTQVFQESSHWARILNVDTVGALNDRICRGELEDIMRVSEALHEKKIVYTTDMISQQKKSIVLIAGPSSSGKTTFAERLCIQLRVNGITPYVISLDNYFVNRQYTPLDQNGDYDFESPEAIDTKQLNKDLTRLLAGEAVEMPSFNFVTGQREYKGRYLKLREGDVLVIEGIHALNEQMTADIPKSNKFKIFISAMTQINIDDHNRIPTTDTRLIRRIVRDNRSRGADAAKTINMWPSVLRGENRNIFPFQEEADMFFNSALAYEMCVLKQFVEPLLFAIDKAEKQYTEAKRLIKFLDSFLGVNSEPVPSNSILREFIGGGCFHI